jgi:hypothetical protein
MHRVIRESDYKTDNFVIGAVTAATLALTSFGEVRSKLARTEKRLSTTYQ